MDLFHIIIIFLIYLSFILNETFVFIQRMVNEKIPEKKVIISNIIIFSWNIKVKNFLIYQLTTVYTKFVNQNNQFCNIENIRFKDGFNVFSEAQNADIENLF